MSSYLKPVLYSGRGLENQWKNIIFQSHDLMCGCPKPLDHLKHLLQQESCLHFKETTTEETGGTTANDELGIDAGDLENLFATENDVDEG